MVCTLRLVWLCSLLILGPYCIYLRVDCGLYPEVGAVVQLIDPWTVLYVYLKVDCGLYPEVGVVVELIDPWTVLYLLEG